MKKCVLCYLFHLISYIFRVSFTKPPNLIFFKIFLKKIDEVKRKKLAVGQKREDRVQQEVPAIANKLVRLFSYLVLYFSR
jgi:hypothetical protein